MRQKKEPRVGKLEVEKAKWSQKKYISDEIWIPQQKRRKKTEKQKKVNDGDATSKNNSGDENGRRKRKRNLTRLRVVRLGDVGESEALIDS